MARRSEPTRKPRARRPAPARAPRRGRTLKLHRELYPDAAVQEAVAAFGDLAAVTVTERAPYHVLAVTPAPDVDPDQVVRELANYALSRAARCR